MEAIYKYTLSPAQEKYKIPSNKILSAVAQNHDIQIYAIVNTDKNEQTENYDFKVFGTGHIIDIDLKEYTFLNTVQLDNLVFHIFYKKII